MEFMQSSTSHLFLLSSTLPSYHIFFFASIFPSIYFVSSPIYFVLHCIFAICQNRYLQRLLFPGTDGSTILSNISNNVYTLNSLIVYCKFTVIGLVVTQIVQIPVLSPHGRAQLLSDIDYVRYYLINFISSHITFFHLSFFCNFAVCYSSLCFQ